MTQWETIHDHSSHISQVRLVAPKNYSVERGNGMFDAVSKSSIPTNTTNMSKHKNIKKSKSMFKSILFKFILIFIITTSTLSLYWQCSKPENSSNNICLSVNQLQQTPSWIVDTKSLINQSLHDYSQITQPLISKVHDAYHWIDITNVKSTATEQLGNIFKPLFDTKDRIMHAYLTKIPPLWDSTKETITMYLSLWRQQLDNYFGSGKGGEQDYSSGHLDDIQKRRGEDSMVEEKIKKTAKRILDYIDQINQESVKSGMKQEEAKEKAQEIIKSITEEMTMIIPKEEQQQLGDRDIDIVVFEIQSIMEVAKFEKTQLKEQLELVQSRLSDIIDQEDTDLLFVTALKSEIDVLRSNAENNVRKRTKQALDRLNNDDIILTTRMKEDVHQAQRAALKDLRQIYRDIYHTNQVIDNLVIT